MKLYIEKQGDKLEIENLQNKLLSLKDGTYSVEIKKIRDIRTLKQNNALHLWFTHVANELNGAGCPLRIEILGGNTMERKWTMVDVKYNLFYPVMKAIAKVDSTAKLKRAGIDACIEPIQDWLSKAWQIECQFPSEEELRIQSLINNAS